MTPVLLAAVLLAAASGTALAGEGGHDYFAQSFKGVVGTFSTRPAVAPAQSAARGGPSDARLPPGSGDASRAQTPNIPPRSYSGPGRPMPRQG